MVPSSGAVMRVNFAPQTGSSASQAAISAPFSSVPAAPLDSSQPEDAPQEAPYALPEGFVLLADAVPDILQEIRYYSTYNFVGSRIDGYEQPCAILTAEAAQALRARDMDCKLVFLTTSEDFMRQGFSLNSAHYLIKPVKDEDFAQAMANCRLGRALQVPTLAVTVEGRTLEVDTRQIRYLEVQQRSVVLHTTRGDLPLGRSFSAAAAPLERDRRFLLCFKGVLVNMDHIAAQTGDELRLDNGSILPIAPRRRREILAQYRAYMFGRMREP